MRSEPFVGHRTVRRLDGTTADAWRSYICGYCDHHTAGAVVARWTPTHDFDIAWLACTHCGNGSVMSPEGVVYPSAKFGPRVEGLPADVEAAYEEARASLSVSAWTGCELICRKILMHVAVEKGAKAGDGFATYINHLEQSGYVTPPMKPWVDQIRRIGNAATHTLEKPERMRAESALMFTAELLRLVYEMEYLTRRYAPQQPP